MPSAPIASALRPFVDRHQLAGAVAVVASADKMLDVSWVGFADIAAGAPYIANGPSPAGPCGHAGAFANDMSIDPAACLVTIWMVQHAGWPTIDGPTPLEVLKKVAVETYGKA